MKGGRAFTGNNKHGRLMRVTFTAMAWPLDFFGPRAVGKTRAHDLFPGLDQRDRHARALAQQRIENPRRKIAHRDGIAEELFPCHIASMRAVTSATTPPPPPSSAPAEVGGSAATWPRELLAWYDNHHRELPWRVPPREIALGTTPDPYRVWLSEIMLQQTNVTTVRPFFKKFLENWPRVGDLAAADTEDVLRAWAGLGYYSRARNLKACAQAVAARRGGRFPETEATLRELPGVGEYTAAAIAAIAFNVPAVVVDGNVERVVTRLAAVSAPLPQAKAAVRAFLERDRPATRPGDFAQAMMDLGATICLPRRPRCLLCPIAGSCKARSQGNPERYPVRPAKTSKPTRRGAAFVARQDGAILLRTRPEKGLLAAMSEPPTSAWSARTDGDVSTAAAPFAAEWRLAGQISHVFTHFRLELQVYHAEVSGRPAPAGCRWVDEPKVPGEALPSLMKKVIDTALGSRDRDS